jgi:Tfp pilus assembly protein PilF
LARLYLESGNYGQAAVHGRKALEIEPRDQGSLYRLVQILKKSGKNEEIPELLKRIASLRQQAAQNQRELNRYKLVEGEGR